MIYKVQARFNFDKAEEFYEKLTDGTIENQQPDGREMVASMKRASIDGHGVVHWTEMCFCPTPLRHERATVYDHYFSEMKTEIVEDHEFFEGQPFMEKLSLVT